MKLLADLHTHTNFSRFKHGKNTIEEMALEANEMGLVEIGITDHGYQHFFRTSKDKLKEARKIIDEINEWSKTKVLLGVEADIISDDGTLDIDNETLSLLDILIVSYHRMTSTNFASYFGFAKKTEEAKRKCTNAFVNAINKYPVTLVAHLDSILTTDLYEIGLACKARGTLVEINNRHTKWNDRQVEDLIASGCMFAVSSDAHAREKVGRVDKAFDFIKKYNIPSERIANIEFEDEEMSEEDRKFSAYKSVYEQLAKTKRDREDVIETKQKTQITGKISDEMENELRKIASEKGLEYKEYKTETAVEGFMKDISDDDMELIRAAEEYIKRKTISEVEEEHDEIDVSEEYGVGETFSFEDDHPLLKGSFEDRFQPFNKKLVEEKKPNVVVYEEAIEEPAEDVEETQPVSAFDQLSATSSKLQAFKDVMTGGGAEAQEVKVVEAMKPTPEPTHAVQTRQVFKKPEPENFMGSITRKNLVNNSTPIEVAVEKEVKPVETKPAPQKTGRRGGFISVDNLFGGKK